MEGVYRSESSVLRPVTAIEIHQSYFDTRCRLSFVWLFDETLSVSVVGVRFVTTTRTVNCSSFAIDYALVYVRYFLHSLH